jgi:hypothetical protein
VRKRPQGKKRQKSAPASSTKQARGGSSRKAAATPVAVNGSVGLTPNVTGSHPTSALCRTAGASGGGTAARPPRPSLPAKTPGTAATGGSLARALDGSTPMTGLAGKAGSAAGLLEQHGKQRFRGCAALVRVAS